MKIRQIFILSILLSTALFLPKAYAKTYQVNSSPNPVGLIELYTSQGCSSCPPADKWLSELEGSGVSKKQAIPIALHVDYWDYIGWKDQFAQKYFAKRQYRYRQVGHSSSVYTPQIMLNGEDVRRVKFRDSLKAKSQEKAVVDFSVIANDRSANTLSIDIAFKRIDPIAKNSQIIVVLAENKLVGNIHAGENAGRTLSHNHVVRVWKNIGKINQNLKTNLTLKKDWNKENLELIVFVETKDMQTQQVVQLALQ